MYSYYSRDDRVNHRNSIGTSQFMLKNKVLISAIDKYTKKRVLCICLRYLLINFVTLASRKFFAGKSQVCPVNVHLCRYILHSTVPQLLRHWLVDHWCLHRCRSVDNSLRVKSKSRNQTGERKQKTPHPSPKPPPTPTPSCNNKQLASEFFSNENCKEQSNWHKIQSLHIHRTMERSW